MDDLGEKEAVLAAHPRAFFTIPHFDGYAAVLVRLGKVTEKELREAIVDGWLVRARRCDHRSNTSTSRCALVLGRSMPATMLAGD